MPSPTLTRAGPLLIYSGLSLVYFGTTGSWTTQYFGGGDSDVFAYIWFLNWWPFAIAHHLNPFVTNYMWYPGGYNLTWAASVPLAALLGLPASLIYGPVLAYNLLTISAPPLAAWTTFLLARYLTGNWAASLIGGYLFGFSSYEIAKLIGQLNLDTIWLIPLAVWLCAARVRQHIGRPAFIAMLAALLFCQLGLATEILATSCLFGAMAWAVVITLTPAAERPPLWRLAAESTAAILVMALAALPFVLSLWHGLAETPPQFNSPVFFSADPINYVIPSAVTLIGGTAAATIAANFTGGLAGQSAYLGLPLVILIGLYAAETFTTRIGRALLIIFGLLFVFSLGPTLHFGKTLMNIPLPWALGVHIPIIRNLLPIRFPLYIALAAGVITAFWLSAAVSPGARAIRYALGAIACAALIPNPATLPWTPIPVSPFFTPKNIATTIGQGKNVLILPFGGDGAGAIFQMQAGMSFTQTGGYLGYVPRHEASQQVVDDLVNGVADPNFNNQFPTFCASHKLNEILITPDAEPALAAAVTAQHWPQRTDHGVIIISVPGITGS